MQDTKIPKLNTEELNALLDVKFFKLKQEIIQKAVQLLNQLEKEIKKETINHKEYIPAEVMMDSSKISRGENYLGLPYLVLDYPRHFRNEDIFAFRSIFWWGNYFSFTLQLSGKYLDHFKPNLIKNISEIKIHDTYISTGRNPWVHHINNDSYVDLESWKENPEISLIETINKLKFIKLVRKIDLNNWNEVIDYGRESYNLLLKMLS